MPAEGVALDVNQDTHPTTTLTALFLLCASVYAIMPGENDYPWGVKLGGSFDAAVAAAYPEGSWFLDLGPTGIRAKIDQANPTELIVMFVFQDRLSPAPGNGQPQPEATTVDSERETAIRKVLLGHLVRLAEKDLLTETPITFSKASVKVFLSGASDEGTVTYQICGRETSKAYPLAELTPIDRAHLVLLVSRLAPDDRSAHALAGVILQSIGEQDLAEEHLERAGQAAQRSLEALIEAGGDPEKVDFLDTIDFTSDEWQPPEMGVPPGVELPPIPPPGE